MPSNEAAITLKQYLAYNYKLLASEKVLQENLVIKKIQQDPSSWKNVLLELKASNNFSFSDYNHLVARIGQDLLLKLDKDSPFNLKSEISVTDLLSSSKGSNLIGSYLDVAKAQAAMFEVLGISSYVTYQQSLFGNHATTLSINPHDPLDITQFYYDQIETPPIEKKSKSLKPATPNLNLLSANGKLVSETPLEIKEKIEQIKSRPERTFGTPEYRLEKVKINVGNIELGDVFKGTTSDGTEIIGITKLEKKLEFKGPIASLKADITTKVSDSSPKATDPNDPLISIDPNLPLDPTAQATRKLQNSLNAKLLSQEYNLAPGLNIQFGVSSKMEVGGRLVVEDVKKNTQNSDTDTKLSFLDLDGKSNVSPNLMVRWEDPDLNSKFRVSVKGDLDPVNTQSKVSVFDTLNAKTEIGGETGFQVGNIGKAVVGALVTLKDANPESVRGSVAYRPSSMSEFFVEGLTSLNEDDPGNTFSAGLKKKFDVLPNSNKPIDFILSFSQVNSDTTENILHVGLKFKL